MKVYTIRDIARLSGVGISTVSRVLNGRPDVSDATRARVMAVVESHNYTQNNNARNLKQRRRDLISLIVRGRENPFLSDLAERIIASRRRDHFVLDFLDAGDDEIAAAQRHITEQKVKAVLFLGASTSGRQEEITSLGLPCVLVAGDACAPLPLVSSIGIDGQEGAHMAIEHLVAHGHRRIVLFGGADGGAEARYRGAVAALKAHGIPFSPALHVPCPLQMEQAYGRTAALLESGQPFTAIFALSDVLAIGILKALGDHGLRVPEAISVIGFDGIPLARFTMPTLATISQPADMLAQTALALADRLLADPTDTERVLAQSTLIPGESVRRLS